MTNKRKIHICACGDHAFVEGTKGATFLVSIEDVVLLASKSWFAGISGRYATAGGGKYSPFVLLHRLVMQAGKGEQVDHVSRNSWDNRRENLRRATPAQQVANRKWKNKTGYKGVWSYIQPDGVPRFVARIYAGGTRHHLGVFASLEDAARAYDRAAKDFFGDFAVPNFPEKAVVSKHKKGESVEPSPAQT